MSLRSLLDTYDLRLRAPDGEGTGATDPQSTAPSPAAADPPVPEEGSGLTPPATEGSPTEETPPVETPSVEPTPDPVEPPTEGGKTPAWVMPRIAKLSARVRELEGQTLDTKAGGAPPTTTEPSSLPEGSVKLPDGRVLSGKDLQDEISRQASLIQLNTDLLKMVEKGNSEFPDFQQSIATLRDGIGIMTQPFLEAVLETGEAHKVLQHLANDPDKAAQLATLSPVRQAVALAKYAEGLNRAPTISKTPAPIAPKVRGSAKVSTELDDPGVSMDEFMKKRNAHEAEMRKNGSWR